MQTNIATDSIVQGLIDRYTSVIDSAQRAHNSDQYGVKNKFLSAVLAIIPASMEGRLVFGGVAGWCVFAL